MASFYPRPGKREAWARAIGVTAVALSIHVAVLAVIEPPQVDPAVLSGLRFGADGLGDREPTVVEVDDALVDLDCQGAVTLRTLGRLGLCELRGDGDACREQAWSTYRIDSVGCREPLATPELGEITPTTLVDTELLQLPPLDELVAPEEEDPEEDEPEDEEPEGQVVEIAKPNVEIRPDDADFVAEYDSKVDKQTIKRGRPDGGEPSPPPSPRPTREPQADDAPSRVAREVPDPAPGSAPTETPSDAPPPPEAPDRAGQPTGTVADGPPRPGKEGAPGALSMRSDPVPQAPVGEEFGADEIAPDGLAPRFGRRFETERPEGRVGDRGEGGAGGPARPLSPGGLRPSSETLSKAVARGSDDYLPGIDEGEGTALNAKRWKHASFFNRVKGQVRQNWNPQRAYRLRDPTGNIYGTKDRLTVVTVSLKPDGTLNNVWIAQPSGVDFLDEEAVTAFRQAQPFPNPPDALVDRDSRLITFRFGFMFQINNRAGWKVFRYR